MGRTQPTFRLLLDRLEDDWREYRRGLRVEEQQAFDELLIRAHRHASASGNVATPDPLEAVFLSILLEHEMDIQRLKRKKDG